MKGIMTQPASTPTAWITRPCRVVQRLLNRRLQRVESFQSDD